MINKNIIIFSSDDWGWKTSKYQLSIRFAKKNKVLFVSSVGFRTPSLSGADLSRIVKKIKNFFRGIKKIDTNLYVLTPLVIPFIQFDFIKKINRSFLKFQISYAQNKLKMGRPYHFVFSQNWYELIKNFKREKLVYYCVDEHSGFKGVDVQKFEEQDNLISQAADKIFCSSKILFEKKKENYTQTHYMPHGVNYDLFSKVVFDETLSVADDVKHFKAPVIGFYGHISYDWIDFDLLKHIAEKKPNWNILLIGKISIDKDEFISYDNIHVIGERNFESLPGYCKIFDVATIPFVKSTLTENCNPLKLYEYLAAGLPVVSTDIPEVRQYQGDVFVANDYSEFLDLCEKCLVKGKYRHKVERSLTVRDSSWENRVDQIYSIVSN